MNQARVVDVHAYYRTGGIDWDKLKAHFDAVIISAGVGTWVNPILGEQIEGAIANAVPFATYHIPDVADGSMREQARFYLRQITAYGAAGNPKILDIEPPYRGQRCITSDEAYSYTITLDNESGDETWEYSNPNILQNHLHNPVWITHRNLWVAQYPWRIGFPFYIKYKDYETFLARYAGLTPAWVQRSIYKDNCILWQFTDKGNAQALCANAYTLDPIYREGIKEADLNVSTIEKEEFLELFGTPPAGQWYYVNVPERYIREEPNQSAPIIETLIQNDRVRITGTVESEIGDWGIVVEYITNGEDILRHGYIYMNNLLPVPVDS